MIVAKQTIKTNQILSVGWSLSIRKIREKLRTNQQSSLKRYVKCALQTEQQNQHHPSASFTFHSKKIILSFLHGKTVQTVHMCRLLHRQVYFLQYYFTQERNQINFGCQSSWYGEGWMCARSCSIWMKFNSYKLLKRNTLIHLRVWSPIYFSNPILGSNSKSFQVFHPWTPLRGLRVICWLVCWIGVSPAFDF